MKCELVRDLLSAYMDNELGADTIREVDAHLRTCPACSAELEELRLQHRVLAKALATPVQSSPWLAERAMAEAQRRQTGLFGMARGYLGRAWLRSALGVAAVLAILLTVVVWPRGVRLVAVQGTPQYAQAGSSAWHNARRGMRVTQGLRLHTRQHEMITVRWPDGSQLVLGPESQATMLPDSSPAGASLAAGRVYAQIRPQQMGFQIAGPQATATVVGTEFWLSAGHGETWLFVMRGKVRFSNDHGSVLVSRWRKSFARADGAPSPLLPTSPLDSNSFWWLRHS